MLAQPQLAEPTDALDPDLNEFLAQERGWSEVAAGLTRILLGWGVLVVGFGTGIGLLVLSVFLKKHAMHWAFFGGLAVLSLAGTFSWWTVLAGLLRCLLHSPERLGVRWFIFVCMLCLAIGPILNVASSLLCTTEKPEFDKGVAGIRKIRLDSTGRFIQAMCTIGTVGYHVAFVLFLRSIGCCFRSIVVVRLTELFLLAYVGVVATVFYLVLFKLPWLLLYPPIIVGLGLAVFLLFIFYVALVILARACIAGNLTKVRTTMGEAVFSQA